MCAQCERLQDRVAELETAMGLTDRLPIIADLRPGAMQFLALLLRRKFVSREAAHIALYGLRPDDQQPQLKIFDTYVCHLRRRLPQNVAIVTHWGLGWSMSDADKATCSAWLATHGWQP